MIPEFYQNHLKSQLNTAEFIFLKILLNLLQSIKKVNLEKLANALPLAIKFESRRKRIQRFLSLPNLTLEKIWFPLVTTWLATYFTTEQLIYVAIDRTNWHGINLLMISVVWDKRSFPLYWELLPKLGSSNIVEQQHALSQVIPLLQNYQICLLGDREFCSVKLAKYLQSKGVYFCLRLKKNEFIEVEKDIWIELNKLGLTPGTSFFIKGVKVTKTKGFISFNVAGKWKGLQKYIARVKEYGRNQRRHSSFYIGLYGQTWLNFKQVCLELVTELMKINRNKLKYYQRGLKAMKLIESIL